jgi:GNAT superfamily N-acetyltransferase
VIIPVESRSTLRTFVDLPESLYRGAPGWTPSHRATDFRFHDPARGPFFTFGTARSFLACGGGRVRGRITAHINHAYNTHHGTTVGGFGFLDAEPVESVVGPLLDSAEAWLAARGCTTVWGPLDFCMYDRVGLLVDGFERPMPMNTAYHAPALSLPLGAHGYRKKRDVLTFAVPAPDGPPAFVRRVVDRGRLPGLSVRHYRPRRLLDEARAVREVVDRAFGGHWLHFPLPEGLMRFHAEEMAALVQPANVVFAEIRGEPVGVMIVVPDLGPLLRARSGRIVPFGLPAVWRQCRSPRELLVLLLAVVPEYHTLGVVAHLIDAAVRAGLHRHCRRVCTTWVDEQNTPMVNAFRRFGGSVYARHRILEKPLGVAGADGSSAGYPIVSDARSRG